eukprot:180217-Prymnesium_polylepis.1
MEAYQAYCEEIDPLPPELLGTTNATVVKHGHKLASPFSPQLATALVRIKQDPCGQGRWISCGLLRPFVPMDMPEDSAVATVAQMLDEGRHNPTVGSRARR